MRVFGEFRGGKTIQGFEGGLKNYLQGHVDETANNLAFSFRCPNFPIKQEHMQDLNWMQEAIALLRGKEDQLKLPMQFGNFRD